MQYILTEEEYFHMLESQSDIAKLKVALRQEYEQQKKYADDYSRIGSYEIAKDYADSANVIMYIINKYL